MNYQLWIIDGVDGPRLYSQRVFTWEETQQLRFDAIETDGALTELWNAGLIDIRTYTKLRQKLTFCTRVKMLICAAAEYTRE